jgi:hypothetical protein
MDNETDIGTVEEQATRMGWVELEDFRGSPDHWVPADKFIERAETILPLAKGTIKEMQKLMAQQETNFRTLLAEQKTEFDTLKASTANFAEFAKKSEERAYERALAELKGKQRAAAEDRDVAGVEAIGAEIEAHIKSHPAVTGVAPTTVDEPAKATAPVNPWIIPGQFEAWQADNIWYNEKPNMAVYADQMDKFLMRTKPGQSQKERLSDIARLVKEEFPTYFTNPAREAAGVVEGGGDAGSRPSANKRGYANLSSDAKAVCDEFTGKDGKGKTGTIEGFTREDYLAQCDPSLFTK